MPGTNRYNLSHLDLILLLNPVGYGLYIISISLALTHTTPIQRRCIIQSRLTIISLLFPLHMSLHPLIQHLLSNLKLFKCYKTTSSYYQ